MKQEILFLGDNTHICPLESTAVDLWWCYFGNIEETTNAHCIKHPPTWNQSQIVMCKIENPTTMKGLMEIALLGHSSATITIWY